MTSAACLSPVPRARLAGSAAVSLLAHALVFATLLWQASPGHRSPPPAASDRPMMLWLRAAKPVAPLPPLAMVHVPAAAPRHPAATVPVIDATPEPAATALAPPGVSGVAFAPPALKPLSAVGRPSAARVADASTDVAATAIAAAPPPAVLMQPMLAAARAQLGHALTLQLSTLPVPPTAGDGQCTLAEEPDSLRCDDERLQTALADRAGALASLMRAYRHADPQARHVAVALREGHYRLDIR